MAAAVEECRLKHEIVRDYMAGRDLDAVVLTKRANFAWFTGGGLNHVGTGSDAGAASLVVMPDRLACVTNNIEGPRMADEELAGLGVEVLTWPWQDGGAAGPTWKQLLGDRRAACDAKVAGLPESVKGLPGDFDRLRWSLIAPEIERYRVLAREAAACLEAACRQARRGMSEYQLAGRIQGALMEREIRSPVVLIAADERIGKYRHPIPTAATFKKYGMAVLGAERGGLIASCTRLFSFGPIDSDIRRRHDAVCQIDAALIGQTRPGKTLGELFETARRIYADTGYADEWTRHHQGGPTGYTARDAKGSPGNKQVVLENQAFAWNPSISGTKCEDTILVTPRGNEVLTWTGQWPASSYAGGGRSWDRAQFLTL